MAITDSLPDDSPRLIAEKIGRLVRRAFGDVDRDVVMAESFQIWQLSQSAVQRGAHHHLSFAELVQNTGRWHHQIRIAGQPRGFAWSLQEGERRSDRWSIRHLVASPLAVKLEKSIILLDNLLPEDDKSVARLLLVPSWQIHGLWLKGADLDAVWVFDCPRRLSVEEDTLYDPSDFLSLLAQDRPTDGFIDYPIP